MWEKPSSQSRSKTQYTRVMGKEIDNNLYPAAFTITTIGKRIAKKGDLFAGWWMKKPALIKIVK